MVEKAPARLEKNELTSLEGDCVEELLGHVSECLRLHLEEWKVAEVGNRVNDSYSVIAGQWGQKAKHWEHSS